MRSLIKSGALFILIPIAVTAAIYVPNLGSPLALMDRDSYERVLFTTNYAETAELLLLDFQGRVVPGYYAPLSSISLMLDKWIIGSSTPNLRFTLFINLIFHCANGLLVFLLLRALGIGSRLAGCASFLFLLHPIQVPSVLWFASRKTVMACMFYLLAYLAYFRYRSRGAWRYYLLCVAATGAGLLAKPTVVVLPPLLVICELLGITGTRHESGRRVSDTLKIRGDRSSESRAGADTEPSQADLQDRGVHAWWWGLVPLFLLVAVFAYVTMNTERTVTFEIPFVERVFIAASALTFYLSKVLVPVELTLVYPRWTVDLASPSWWIPPVVLIVGAGILVRFRGRIPMEIWWGLANFLVPLVPVIGFVKFGYFQHSFVAGHLMYLSMIGLSCTLVVAVHETSQQFGLSGKRVILALTAVYCGFLLVQTWNQARLWKDPIRLWADNYDKCESCSDVENMLGMALLEGGRYERAVKHLRGAVKLQPNSYTAHMNLGAALFRMGKMDEARASFERAVAVGPQRARGYANLGLAYLEMGKVPEAKKHLQKALELDGKFAAAYNSMGRASATEGNLKEAVRYFKKAVEIAPEYFDGHRNVGLALMRSGDRTTAIKHLKKAVKIRPSSHKTHDLLGQLLLANGKPIEAQKHFRRAVEILPIFAEAHNNLGVALETSGHVREAAREYERAFKIAPGLVDAHFNYANAMVRLGEMVEAVRHYETVVAASPYHYLAHSRLGSVYLHMSQFPQAVEHLRAALKIRPNLVEAQRNLESALKASEGSQRLE